MDENDFSALLRLLRSLPDDEADDAVDLLFALIDHNANVDDLRAWWALL